MSKYFEIKMGHPLLSVGESIQLIHVCAYRTVICGMVNVSRDLERANENDDECIRRMNAFNQLSACRARNEIIVLWCM